MVRRNHNLVDYRLHLEKGVLIFGHVLGHCKDGDIFWDGKGIYENSPDFHKPRESDLLI